jgi:hypothetical protein
VLNDLQELLAGLARWQLPAIDDNRAEKFQGRNLAQNKAGIKVLIS